MRHQVKQNWFATLNEALESESLVDFWPFGKSMEYGENFRFTADNGSKHGLLISIFRETNGMYERPIHYNR